MTTIAPHYWKKRKNAWPGFLKKDLYLVKTPGWLKRLYPGCVWNIKGAEKTLYLTFDDGPNPGSTEFILNQLNTYQAKATFFCIGDNVQKYPELYKSMLNEGHVTANHTMHHVNGWKMGDEDYINNIKQAARLIESNLFRPPYGRIKRSQINKMAEEMPGTRIVMWNILAGDWEQSLTPEKCLRQILKKTGDNDIIVLHDSDKAWARVQYVLPQLLNYYTQKGFRFEAIPGLAIPV